jgi:hypothetical protein
LNVDLAYGLLIAQDNMLHAGRIAIGDGQGVLDLADAFVHPVFAEVQMLGGFWVESTAQSEIRTV